MNDPLLSFLRRAFGTGPSLSHREQSAPNWRGDGHDDHRITAAAANLRNEHQRRGRR